MIDGLFKRYIDPAWERLARPLAKRFTANQITVIGLGLVAALSGLYPVHGSSIWYGVSLAFAFSADSIDGAVARIRREASHFGGYLDAMADRYQELAVFAAIAFHTGQWTPSFFAFAGSFLTSYAKARTAIEMPISNADWPDLLERQERLVVICAMLIGQGLFGGWFAAPFAIITGGLWLLAIGTHVSAVQRFLRARRLLIEYQHKQRDKESPDR